MYIFIFHFLIIFILTFTIAHNDVVYDTRFKKMDPSRPMKQCLILEMGDAVHKFQDYR